MGRPRLSDAEREARRKASKQKWRAKQKQGKQAAKNPASWIKQAAKMVEPKEIQIEETEGPELPGVSLPGFTPAPVDGNGSGASTDSVGPGPAPSTDGDSKSSTDSGRAGDGGNNGGAGENKVDNKELIDMVAGMYAGALTMASDYANKHERPGLPPDLIKVNYDCMKLILTKQLKDSDVDSEEVAAYVCVGSSSWVGFQCFMAYRETNPPKKTNTPTPEVKTDAAAPAANGTNGHHVNGAGKPPPEQVQGLIVRNAPVQGGVYK